MDPTLITPVYTAADVARLLGMTYTEGELAGFAPPPDPLPGFVTLYDPGWPILRLRDALKDRRVFWAHTWYDREPFAAVEDAPRYRQVRATPLPDSFRKTYAEQLTLVPAGEEVAPARTIITALAVHFLGTGQRLLPNAWVRCADKTKSRDDRVFVGFFLSDGLSVADGWVGDRYDHVGLASARK